MIVWDGISSNARRVIVERTPNRVIPRRKFEVVSVPGRNGDLTFLQNAWENYDQPYEVYLSAEDVKLPRIAHGAAMWLAGPVGYARLMDDYDPDVYRLARFDGPFDIESVLNRFGRGTISFNCKPQSFLLSGENLITPINGMKLVNPTGFTALPLITITGSGAGSLQVGGYVLTVLAAAGADYTIMLDAETQNAYFGTANLNQFVACDEFPKLDRGESQISWSGGISGVTIVPRWWTL